MITIKNTQRKFKLNIENIYKDILKILKLLNYSDFDLGVWLTNNKTIKLYNQKYRNKNKPTDILSFQYYSNIKPGQKIKVTNQEDKNLGDLILSIEYIDKEAKKLKISLEEQIKKLIIHGICHLLGYDHIEDQDWRSMRAKEAWILKNIN